ncbi:MAG: hypothetical protein AABX04_08415, partial [Nanoarchaeota archaeon]
TFGKGDKAKFTLAGGEHYVTMNEVSSDYVKINVTSTLQQATIYVGKEVKFNLNGDGYYDLSVKLNGINVTAKKATLLLKSIAEVITAAKPATSAPQEEVAAPAESLLDETEVPLETVTGMGQSQKEMVLAGLVAVVIIIVILAAVIFVRRRYHEHKRGER